MLIVLVGCAGFQRGGQPPKLINVRIGTDGLVMSFMKEAPPQRVAEDELFIANLDVRNKGATDITDGIIIISTDQYLTVQSWDSRIIKQTLAHGVAFDLEGKKQINPEGDFDVISVTVKAGTLDEQVEIITSPFIATACYLYSTATSVPVCIDTDPFGLRKVEKVCQLETKTLGSQGGPIAIKQVETRMLPMEAADRIKPRFEITISNAGRGQVVSTEKYQHACTAAALGKEDLNRLSVRVELPEEELECTPDVLKLKEGKATIRCEVAAGIDKGRGTFPSSLSITLEYGYTFSISKNIEIRKDII